MGIGYGLIQGLTGAARGINQGKADARELERQAREAERKALHDALAQKLMEAQINKMSAPPAPVQDDWTYHYDPETGSEARFNPRTGERIVMPTEGGRGKRVPKVDTPTERNIDPLSQEGIAAAAAREKAIKSAIPPSQGRPVAAIVAKVASNRAQSSVIRGALQKLQMRPEGIGLKGYIPDAILQRDVPGLGDPEGVGLRADIADIGSLKIHDRSGAAVTVSEAPRLKPFIPLITDTPEAAKIKLTRLLELLESETDFLQQAPADADATEGVTNAVPGGVVAPRSGGKTYRPNNPFAPK